MNNLVDKMIKHPIKTTIIITGVLNGVASIIREINNLCKTCKGVK